MGANVKWNSRFFNGIMLNIYKNLIELHNMHKSERSKPNWVSCLASAYSSLAKTP